jgi:tight adherence protein C
MPDTGLLPVLTFVAAGGLTLMLFLALGGRKSRLDERLRSLADPDGEGGRDDAVADVARAALPKVGAYLVPKSEDERSKLQTRLVHAGLYSREAMVLFLGVKVFLMVGPALIGGLAGLVGLVSLQAGIVFGCLLGVFGMIGPSFWLDAKKAGRQTSFRRALPDALDVLVICLEGGSSLISALRRVSGELSTAHPLLAAELNIVQREVQLGRTVGDALRQFANRVDLEELRSLAAVILQSEKFGASLVKALRVHAESLRQRRVSHAEELAQKAVVKMLFPMVFFIMPALFIAVLGPTGIMILELFPGASP